MSERPDRYTHPQALINHLEAENTRLREERREWLSVVWEMEQDAREVLAYLPGRTRDAMQWAENVLLRREEHGLPEVHIDTDGRAALNEQSEGG